MVDSHLLLAMRHPSNSFNSMESRSLPTWKVHTLTGDRKGTWSLSVTRNRRLTFRIDIAEREICDLNLEDYH
jgi:toxin HigB-1